LLWCVKIIFTKNKSTSSITMQQRSEPHENLSSQKK
jgi:hypothetical protein